MKNASVVMDKGSKDFIGMPTQNILQYPFFSQP
jgi:hypothetical protein